jgi:hypothetical protein
MTLAIHHRPAAVTTIAAGPTEPTTMASLIRKPNGRYHLQFTPRAERRQPGQLRPNRGKRQSIALGDVDKHDAEGIKRHVEELVKSVGKR